MPKREATQPAEADPAKNELVQQAAHMARLRADALLEEARTRNDSASEGALAEFIRQCEFADARLIAAAGVQTRPWLTQVHHAMRNTDRRVAKLMQSRLDALARQEVQQQQMEQCIAHADHLLHQSLMTANQVAELDRAWQSIPSAEASAHGPLALTQQFETVRAALAQRLQAQTALQRALLDDIAALRLLAQAGADQTAADLGARLEHFREQIRHYAEAAEAASLPRHLPAQLADECTQAAARIDALARLEAALTARAAALEGWLAAAPATLDAGQLRSAWQALPRLADEQGAALQARFDALLQQVREAHPPKPAAVPASATTPAAPKRRADKPAVSPEAAEAARLGSEQIDGALAAMEAALEQGSLHLAQQHDKALRESLPKRLSERQAGQLAHLRAELTRLTGWAKWGGNVSREELIKTVEDLPGQHLPVTDLAKKVGGAREAWKVFDTQSGPAPKSLWERFDAACTLAYAPAAAHFRQLADERRQNIEKARAVIAEIERFVPDSGVGADAGTVDWKGVAAFCQRQQGAWRQFGPIDRKEKKTLDAQFDAALAALREPLAHQYELEVAAREQAIAEIAALDSRDRGALDTLKNLQLRWQERARALPLPRNVEQALWLRFRAACDAVFAERKESHHAADVERQQHLAEKQALCQRLEQAQADAQGGSEGALGTLLRQAHSDWQALGEVPRASADQVNHRYAAARAALEQRQAALRRAAGAEQAQARRARLQLCQQLEAALVAEPELAPDAWRARWQALPVLGAALERPLAARFERALAAAADPGARMRHVALLEKNRAALHDALLRLEISAGVASPPEHAAARLKMQVLVLQESFKSGGAGVGPAEQLAHLCALPALADGDACARIDALFAAMAV